MMTDHDLLTTILVGVSMVAFLGMAGCFASIIKEIRVIHGLQAAIFLLLRQQGIDLTNLRELVRQLRAAGP